MENALSEDNMKLISNLLGWQVIKTACYPKKYKCRKKHTSERNDNQFYYETIEEAKNFILEQHLSSLYPHTLVDNEYIQERYRACKWYHRDDVIQLVNTVLIPSSIWFSVEPVEYFENSCHYWVNVDEKERHVLDNMERSG